jgi:multidrug efflux pump subunit AcrA (membrane-fusion protein)
MSETPSIPPPDLSRLRIQRDEPAASSGGSRRPWIAVAIVLLVVAVAAAALLTRPKLADVRVATVTTTGGGTETGAGISANGYVVARTKASVSAKIAGRLSYLGVHEGSEVKTGQVIARIESDVYAAAAQAAKATSRGSRSSWRRRAAISTARSACSSSR